MRYDQSIECTGTAFWCTTQHSTSVHVKWTTRLAPSRIRFRDYTSTHECPLVVRKRVVKVQKGPWPSHLIVAWKKAPRKTAASTGSSLRAFQRRQGGPKRTPRHLPTKTFTRRLAWPRNQPSRQ